MERCEKCGDLLFSWEKHSCEEYTIIDEDGEAGKVYGTNEEDAVERYAKALNEDYGDYCLMSNCMIVTVDGTRYRIGAEASIDYSIVQID